MIKKLMCLLLALNTNVLIAHATPQSNSNLVPCFNINEIEPIGKQLVALLKQEFCEKRFDTKKQTALIQKILPQIVSQPFLGVTPPEYWQQVANEIIENCLANHDLCKKEARNNVAACAELRLPIIFLQFGPWLSEQCPQLNKSLIQQWPNKRIILKKIIQENKKLIDQK